MGAKEIKEEIKKLDPTQKVEIFKWVNNQIKRCEIWFWSWGVSVIG
jgi:hypothetical protein